MYMRVLLSTCYHSLQLLAIGINFLIKNFYECLLLHIQHHQVSHVLSWRIYHFLFLFVIYTPFF